MSYTGSEKDRFAQNISAIPETPDRKALQHDLITYFNITTSPFTHSINIFLTLKYTISFCFFTSCSYLRYSENFTLNNMWNSSHLLWFPQKGQSKTTDWESHSKPSLQFILLYKQHARLHPTTCFGTIKRTVHPKSNLCLLEISAVESSAFSWT